jgi:hypothetical protein
MNRTTGDVTRNPLAETEGAQHHLGKAILALTAGLGLGAGVMYLWDPDRGRNRRNRLIGEASGLLHRDEVRLEKFGKDLLNRMRGFLVKVSSEVTPEEPVDDETLVERVRSRMGHVLPKAHAVTAHVHNGVVTLEGKLAQSERRRLRRDVLAIAGVKGMNDQLAPRSVFSPGLLVGLAAGLSLLRKAGAPRAATTADKAGLKDQPKAV